MSTVIHQRVELAQRGALPQVVCRLASGWVVMGDPQVMRGYCLLLPDPVVPNLNALSGADRARFLEDMAAVGDALLNLTDAVRINYEILGNLEPALHAHVLPRYADEPGELRTKPIWFYDWDAAPAFDPEQHGTLQKEIAEELHRRGVIYGP